jgi:EAL domain-containing protein (putative c-di-GMP-specific phosphodiesterase class I)
MMAFEQCDESALSDGEHVKHWTRAEPDVTELRLDEELTESLFMRDAVHFEKTLTRLKQLGVTLAIDDFARATPRLVIQSDFRSMP